MPEEGERNMYNMDRLYEVVAERGHVCVGLDTAADYIPQTERRKAASDAEAVWIFNQALIDAVIDIAACFKVQIACYEELGLAGLETYVKTLKHIRRRGGMVIADIKRGDIADTALRYARAHFEGDFEADFVTLSPYMGMDSIEPWLAFAESRGKGAFVLMRTSNRGMRDFQYQELGTENSPVQTRRLYDVVGDKLETLSLRYKGKYGYGAFGAVVGADPKSETEREEIAAIREKRRGLFFLIPGYGTQGGAAEDAALLLREGNGGVVNASRSILKAWAAGENALAGPEAGADNTFAAKAARRAALDMRQAITGALEKRRS
jgi:orotidine-5'-phosphate decarboxylase